MPLNRLHDTGQPIQPPPDVQRTSMSLDVMGRFVCNTWDEAIHNGGAPFDAIVIGGGMYGGYAASRLARSAGTLLRVLLLEAGPFLLPTHMQNLPRSGLNVPQPRLPSQDNGMPQELVWGTPWRSNVPWVGQAYCVGGKSLYWGGWCPRLEDDDLERWPSSVAQYLNEFYRKLEQQLGADTTTDFIQGELYNLLHARLNELKQAGSIPGVSGVEPPPLAVQGQSPGSGLFAFDKFSSATLLIDAVRQAAGQSDANRRLFIVPNAHVTRLESHDGVVTGLQAFVDGEVRHLAVSPQCSVILAAGMIESTRLALLSFPTSANGQPEMIGRHLISHVRSNMKFKVRRSALDRNGTLPDALQAGALLVRGRGPQGKFHIQVTASADANNDPDALLYAMIPDVDQLAELQKMQNAGWIAFYCRGSSEMQGMTTPVPNDDSNWIDLSPFESDEFGMRRAYVSMKTSKADEALAAAMDQAMIALAHGLANGDPNDLDIMANPFRDALGSTYHESGTMWMGTDPASSVTDTNGRFHHVANAYVADQSLFVTVGSVNPVLTGMTLTRKVTDAVIARAQGQPAPA